MDDASGVTQGGLRPGAGWDNVSGGAVSLIPGRWGGRPSSVTRAVRPGAKRHEKPPASPGSFHGKPWGGLGIPGQICQDAPSIPCAASSTADASPSGGAAAVSFPPEKKSISPSTSSTPAKAIL